MPMINYGAGIRSNPMDAYNETAGMVRQSRLAKLLGEAYQQPEGERQGALARMMQIDPDAGFAAAKVLDPRLAQGTEPGGLREFRAMTQGMSADDVARARRVALGLDPRAITGAMKFGTFEDAQGRPRPQRNNPTTGQSEIYHDETGQWTPLGGVPQPQQAPQPPTVGLPINIRYDGPEEDRAAFMASIQADQALGAPQGNYTQSLGRQPPQRAWTENTANQYGNAGLGVGMSASGKAYATEAGKTRAQLDNADAMGQWDARNAGRKEAETQNAQLDALTRRNALEAQGAGQAVTAKLRAEAAEAWPAVKNNAMLMVDTIDTLLAHPGRKVATGLSSRITPGNFIPGQPGYDFKAKAKQIEGQAFLQAFNMLRGGGQITEIEGEKATAAIAAMDQAQSEEQYEKALRDVRQVAVNAMKTHTEKMRGAQGSNSGGQRKVVRTGTQNGRKVVQYSDGSVQYAD